MGKPKTNKAIKSRFKKTKKGKVLHRKPGQSHFRSKKSGDKKREKRKLSKIEGENAKKIEKEMKK